MAMWRSLVSLGFPIYNILVPETRKFHRKRGSYFFCLVPRVAVWYPFSFDCSFTSVIMTSQSKAQRFQQRQMIAVTLKRTFISIFLFKMLISRRYEKNSQVLMLNPDRQISVSGDMMSHPNHLDWYLWHRISLDRDLSVWIQHWYLILLVHLPFNWIND